MQDPTRILISVQVLVNLTPAADARINPTAAIPASFPSPATASSTVANFVSSPSKPPEQSVVPDPGPGRPVGIAQSKGSDLEKGPDIKSAQTASSSTPVWK